jgi:hypothetical protein
MAPVLPTIEARCGSRLDTIKIITRRGSLLALLDSTTCIAPLTAGGSLLGSVGLQISSHKLSALRPSPG